MYPTDNVQNLIDKAVRLADGQPITQIRARLGDLTGLAPDQVQAAFEQCRLGTPAASASLHLQREPGRVVCLACDGESLTYVEGEACPACGSVRRQVVGGHQLALEGVSVDRSTAGTRRPKHPASHQAALARSSVEGGFDDGY